MKKYLLIIAVLIYSCGKENTKEPDKLPEENKWINKWITEVLEYKPSVGQFINQGIGGEKSGNNIIGDNRDMISLGTFGGYVIFRFEKDIENKEGNDIAIFGNSFGGSEVVSSEPAIVMVSYDDNKNGKPDDTWYELKGSEYDKLETVKNYKITYYKPKIGEDTHKVLYRDNNTLDTLDFNSIKIYHKNSPYPNWEKDSITFVGTKLKTNSKMENGKWTYPSYDDGYVDNKGHLSEGDLRGADTFNIDKAIDNKGQKVELEKVTFIKVYSAVLDYTPIAGERSSEIIKALYLH